MSNDLYEEIKKYCKGACNKQYSKLINNVQIFDDVFHDALIQELKYKMALRVLGRFRSLYNEEINNKYRLEGVELLPEISETDLTEFLYDIEAYDKHLKESIKKTSPNTNLKNLRIKKVPMRIKVLKDSKILFTGTVNECAKQYPELKYKSIFDAVSNKKQLKGYTFKKVTDGKRKRETVL